MSLPLVLASSLLLHQVAVRPAAAVTWAQRAGVLIAPLFEERCAEANEQRCFPPAGRYGKHQLRALDLKSGEVTWSTETYPVVLARLEEQGVVTAVLAADHLGKNMAVLDAATGKELTVCTGDRRGFLGALGDTNVDALESVPAQVRKSVVTVRPWPARPSGLNVGRPPHVDITVSKTSCTWAQRQPTPEEELKTVPPAPPQEGLTARRSPDGTSWDDVKAGGKSQRVVLHRGPADCGPPPHCAPPG